MCDQFQGFAVAVLATAMAMARQQPSPQNLHEFIVSEIHTIYYIPDYITDAQEISFTDKVNTLQKCFPCSESTLSFEHWVRQAIQQNLFDTIARLGCIIILNNPVHKK